MKEAEFRRHIAVAHVAVAVEDATTFVDGQSVNEASYLTIGPH